MPNEISFDVDSSGLMAKLQKLQDKSGNMQPAMDIIGRKIVNKVRLGFKSSTDPWGRGWEGLKMRIGQPLRDTGALNRSIGYAAHDDSVDIGTNKIYGPIHQYGGVIRPVNGPWLVFKGPGGNIIRTKKVTIPARPYLPLKKDGMDLPDSWAKSVLTALAKHLQVE